MSRATGRTAVVVGGGLAGCLAALALRHHGLRVVVVERDHLPGGAVFRAGVPQSRHAHLLLDGGLRAMEDLLPGLGAELRARGATRLTLPQDIHWLTPVGWMPRYEGKRGILVCTRPVIDWAVRERVQQYPEVEFRDRTEVIGLLGNSLTVKGVRIRTRPGRASGEVPAHTGIEADLVVDASGRGSATPAWLAELGGPPVAEERVDSGIAYASRFYRRAADSPWDFKAVQIQGRPPSAPKVGALAPVEGDRWLVSVAGMRGSEPPTDEAGFTDYLGQLRDPILSRVLAEAEPLGPVHGFRPGADRRRRYEHGRLPAGLLALGDATCTFNPAYAQGMSVAAFGAVALRNADLTDGRRAQRAVAKSADQAWVMTASQDAQWPTTVGGPSGRVLDLQNRYLLRVLARANRDEKVAERFIDVMSLSAPSSTLLRPGVLFPSLFGRAGRRTAGV